MWLLIGMFSFPSINKSVILVKEIRRIIAICKFQNSHFLRSANTKANRLAKEGAELVIREEIESTGHDIRPLSFRVFGLRYQPQHG